MNPRRDQHAAGPGKGGESPSRPSAARAPFPARCARRGLGGAAAARPSASACAEWARSRLTPLLIALGLLGPPAGEAGHEVTSYRSFYPQEIRLEVVDGAAAGALLQNNALHAYLGADAFGRAAVPPHVNYAESLGSFLVLTFNPGSASVRLPEARCAAARSLLQDLAGAQASFTFHPYPVTPYHPDYLQHFDLAEAGKTAARPVPAASPPPAAPPVRMRAKGALAETLAGARGAAGEAWDAALEEVDVATLVGPRAVSLNGWLGPPWLKEGWFHAYLLLAGGIAEPARRATLEATYARLLAGSSGTAKERLNLERALVSLLTQGCERVVVGYTVRRTYFTASFAEGIENIAQDSHAGFLSPIFLRTVKLKDFPWNGWLRLGIRTRPLAAWNPIGGFSDPAGRLVWFAVGDPALLPEPSGGGWIPNRVSVLRIEAPPGGVAIPPEALMPQAGTGVPSPVGARKTAGAKVLYRVPLSGFHDGTRMVVADVLAPYLFAYRWGVRGLPGDSPYDPAVAASTALVRERLAGFRVVRSEREVTHFGDTEVVREVPIVEVYLRPGSGTARDLASLAPPWGTLPWHLLALMEEAVRRGLAAFSLEEAQRRGVEWLDLARGREGIRRLVALTDELERVAFVPEYLKGWVAPGEARERWAALKTFAKARGHLLVTNGPYRLESWTDDAVVLQVIRDLSYPLSVGAFDRYALPPRAFIAKVEARKDGLRIWAEIERAARFQRTYRIVREPLTPTSEVQGFRVESALQYVALGPDRTVRHAGSAPLAADGTFALRPTAWAPGSYTLLLAITPNGNTVQPDVRSMSYRVDR